MAKYICLGKGWEGIYLDYKRWVFFFLWSELIASLLFFNIWKIVLIKMCNLNAHASKQVQGNARPPRASFEIPPCYQQMLYDNFFKPMFLELHLLYRYFLKSCWSNSTFFKGRLCAVIGSWLNCSFNHPNVIFRI